MGGGGGGQLKGVTTRIWADQPEHLCDAWEQASKSHLRVQISPCESSALGTKAASQGPPNMAGGMQAERGITRGFPTSGGLHICLSGGVVGSTSQAVRSENYPPAGGGKDLETPQFAVDTSALLSST